MRVIGGAAKGRRVEPGRMIFRQIKDGRLRPTSSKAREAVFGIIRDELEGASFLDLFAGTGSVGIEALSRGAANATLVESDAARVKAINDLVSRLHFEDRACVIKGDAGRFVKWETERGRKYGIIFLDPPYHSDELMKALESLGDGGMLERNGTVIAEHSSRTDLPDLIGRLKLVKKYKYGDTALTRYRLERT